MGGGWICRLCGRRIVGQKALLRIILGDSWIDGYPEQKQIDPRIEGPLRSEIRSGSIRGYSVENGEKHISSINSLSVFFYSRTPRISLVGRPFISL